MPSRELVWDSRRRYSATALACTTLVLLCCEGSSVFGGEPGGVTAEPRLLATRGPLLYELDAASASATPISGTGLAGIADVYCAELDSNTGHLIAWDQFTGRIVRIHQATGEVSVIGLADHYDDFAFDPTTNVLYGVHKHWLYAIDPATGDRTLIADWGGVFGNATGIAFNPQTSMLWGITNTPDQLIVIDPATAEATLLGAFDLDDEQGSRLTYDPDTNTLYTIADGSSIVAIDPETLVATVVGAPTPTSLLSLTFDAANHTLLAVDRNGDLLITVDPQTAAWQPIVPLGFPSVIGLAYDRNTNTLYGADGENHYLLTIDATTGTGTGIGILPFERVSALAFDPNTDTLYGINQVDGYSGVDELITINPATAEVQIVGSIGFREVEGLAFDENTNTLFGLDDDDRVLITIDTATGAGLIAGPYFPFARDFFGLAFDPGSNTLFATANGVEPLQYQLFAIDPLTGEVSNNGNLKWQEIGALDFDSNSGTLLGTESSTWTESSALLRIDPASLRATAVGTLGFDSVWNLAFDPDSNTLYGSDRFHWSQMINIDFDSGEGTPLTGRYDLGFSDYASLTSNPDLNELYATVQGSQFYGLVRLNPDTGTETVLGPMSSGMTAACFDRISDTLYAANTNDDLFTISPDDAQVSVVGSIGVVPDGLTLDPFNNVLYGVGTDGLFSIDPTSGAGTMLASSLRSFDGIELLYEPACNYDYGDANSDGTVDIFDILCVLDGFAGNFNDCSALDVDLVPCTGGDGQVDIFDILAVLDAFAGTIQCCDMP
ncbi:MAG: hypothetical protein HOP29_04480 [Phycisphaerales bacterium]|nr:hypothetical protein [Phycisphaerales bacterium]